MRVADSAEGVEMNRVHRIALAAFFAVAIPIAAHAQGQPVYPVPGDPESMFWGLLNMGGLGAFAALVYFELRQLRVERAAERLALREAREADRTELQKIATELAILSDRKTR